MDPELSAFALSLGRIIISEAAVEKSFSAQARTYSKIRSRMRQE